MFKNVKEILVNAKKTMAIFGVGLVVGLISISPVSAFAIDGPLPTPDGVSCIDTATKTEIIGYGEDIAVTQLDVLKVIVPAGLGMWGVGFAVKKGLNTLQRKAGKAL